MKEIILASGSPRRKELLKQIGLTFEIIPSNYEEDMTLEIPLLELAKELGLGKAKDVADRVNEGIIIGADTFVAINGKILGKPKSPENAKEQLRMLSGNTHEVYTGIAVIDAKTNQKEIEVAITKVTFVQMSPEEIEEYVATGEPLDKAGSYAIQGIAAKYIEKIEGCPTTVVGLPLYLVNQMLRKFKL